MTFAKYSNASERKVTLSKISLEMNKISYVLSNMLYVQSCFSRPYWILSFDVDSRCDSTARQFCCSQFATRPAGQYTVASPTRCSAARSDNVKNLHITQKYGNLAAAHARKLLPFSVKNELGLENYLGYPSTKFGENRWKIAPVIVDETEKFRYSAIAAHAHWLNPFWL